MSIVMTGGGTGGHLAIIKAVKEEPLRQKPIYIGALVGQDREWFEGDSDFEKCYFLDVKGVVNQRHIGKLISLLKIAKATIKSAYLLKKHKAKVVFSVGGFSAAPTAIAALLLGIPLVIHEQNAAIGRLNRLLKKRAAAFLSSYEESSAIKDYPVRAGFFENARTRKETKTVLFMGGSQGARAINDLALLIAPELQKNHIEIIHQAGKNDIDRVAKRYKEMGVDAEVFAFSKDILSLMKRADFAIARAGASSLWELSANGLPALYIPYPYAASDHQYHNAAFLSKKKLAYVVREDKIEPDMVLELLRQDHRQMSQELIAVIAPGGAAKIAALLESFEDFDKIN